MMMMMNQSHKSFIQLFPLFFPVSFSPIEKSGFKKDRNLVRKDDENVISFLARTFFRFD